MIAFSFIGEGTSTIYHQKILSSRLLVDSAGTVHGVYSAQPSGSESYLYYASKQANGSYSFPKNESYRYGVQNAINQAPSISASSYAVYMTWKSGSTAAYACILTSGCTPQRLAKYVYI